MFFYLIPNSKLVAFVKLAALCAATALCAIWLTVTPAKAQYPWSDTPLMNEGGSNHRPSPGHPGYDSYHRQQELSDRQAEEYRQESLRQERSRSYSAPPSTNNNPYNYPEQVILPNRKSM